MLSRMTTLLSALIRQCEYEEMAELDLGGSLLLFRGKICLNKKKKEGKISIWCDSGLANKGIASLHIQIQHRVAL